MAKKVHKKHFIRVIFITLIGVLIVYGLLNLFLDLNPKWAEPPVLKSQNGVLNLTLDAQKSLVRIGENKQESNVWNGKYIADTWEIAPGDKIKIHYINHMDQPTNLHFHGGHVSPKGNSDNVLLSINPGETFDYEYNIPKDHPSGLFWYHPHLHHYTEQQVMGGMVGAIKVKGNLDQLPGVKGVPERLLVLTTQDKGNDVIRLVNNQLNSTLYIRPLETLRLQFVNASADDFYNLAIPGQKLNIIARDGNTLAQVDSVDSEVLSPGDRIEILFKAGAWKTYDVKSLKYNTGFFTFPETTFMHIKVAGLPVIPKKLPTTLVPYDDLRNVPVDRVRNVTFSEGGTEGNTTFLIDGKEFDPNVVSQIMTLGTTEQWNIANLSGEAHPFHIHINPYQVISVNGVEVDRHGYDDTFAIPPNGNIVIKTKYKDFDGKYVLHCHILFHEDNGMMQVVEVVKPGNSPAPDNGMPVRESMPEMGDMNHESPLKIRHKNSSESAHMTH